MCKIRHISARNIRQFLDVYKRQEQYLGKTRSATDMKTITYFYDNLGMSTDLIEYLIEYLSLIHI